VNDVSNSDTAGGTQVRGPRRWSGRSAWSYLWSEPAAVSDVLPTIRCVSAGRSAPLSARTNTSPTSDADLRSSACGPPFAHRWAPPIRSCLHSTRSPHPPLRATREDDMTHVCAPRQRSARSHEMPAGGWSPSHRPPAPHLDRHIPPGSNSLPGRPHSTDQPRSGATKAMKWCHQSHQDTTAHRRSRRRRG
jgi:hypothetical protein